jgi:arginine decarboxylase-like protein
MAAPQDGVTFAEVIIYCSPIVFGVATWLFIDAYQEIKGDVKDLKTSNSNVRTDIAKQGVKIDMLDAKVTTVCKSVEDVRKLTHEIDKRNGNGVGKAELELAMQAAKQTESRVSDLDKKYGQILMILNGMAKRIGIDIKKTGA